MLSIGVMAHGQGHYYLNLISSEYYLNGGESPGQWDGRGSQELGLAGTVEPEAFSCLLAGLSPDGKVALVQNARAKDRRPGWDLTFSVPKSVSTLWSQADGPTRHIIEEAHGQAVDTALSYLEGHAAFTRRGKGGAIREPVGLVVAAFQHGTSRALDPQLHTHVLVLNIGVRADGTVGAIESRPLYCHKMAAGALHRAELAILLQQRLGLEVSRNGALFEVEGVSATLMAEFSKRRAAIERELAAHATAGARASAAATLATRTAKEHVPYDTLFRQWQETGQMHGFGPEQVNALLHRVLLPEDIRRSAEATLAEAVEQITGRSSFFAEAELVRRIAEAAPGRGLSAKAITDIARHYLACDAVAIGPVDGEARFTTMEMLQLEADLLAAARRLHGGPFHGLSARTLRRTMAHHPLLNDEQKAALLHVAARQGNLHVVSGMAGSGKTTLLAAARQAFVREGYAVIGAALSAKAALALQQGAGIQSGTLHALLHSLEPPRPGNRPVRAGVPTSQGVTLTARSVLVVDEAGMVGTRQMAQLIARVEAARAHLILVGDANQLQPIEAGGPFAALARYIGQAELTTITRQREAWAREAVAQMAEGQASPVLKAFAERGLLQVTNDREEALRALVSDWSRNGVERPDEHLIVASTHHEVRELNRLAQQARLEQGMLGQRCLDTAYAPFYENDRIMFLRNDKPLRVVNGSLATVRRIDPVRQTLTARLDTGRTVTVPICPYSPVQLGYALTTHKAQGATTENAFVLLGGDMQNRELSYVQISRARSETRLYADTETAGPELADLVRQMSTSHRKELAMEAMEPERLLALQGALSLRQGAFV